MRLVDLKIEDIAFGGKGVGREHGKAVFVPYTIEGETVSAEIVRAKKQFTEAELVEVNQSSPNRVGPQCPYFGRCGGCAYQHIDYQHQLAIKWRQVRDALQRIGKLKDVPMRPIIPSPEPYAYRNRITVHALDGVIGFFRRDSRRLIDIECCPIARNEVNTALAELRGHKHVRDGHYALRAGPEPRVFSQVNDGVAQALLDLIADLVPPDQRLLIDAFCGADWVSEVVARGETKATVVSHDGLRFDLRVVAPECFGNVLQHFTGSKDHNIALREDAQRRGLSISEYGVTTVETGEVVTHPDEESLYRYLGYAYIPPELRESGGELAAARNGAGSGLPELVQLSDLRGELHCHSTWSQDGKNTIEEMALAAKTRGYRYLCLTDHSHYLRDGKLEAQWREIEVVNERVKPFRVLRGIEANIRADGSLDVSDDVLAQLDWVVASLHTSFERSPTERILATIDNPNVDSIGHLTGRRLTRREGAPVDVERVVERAAETGTALEINSQPDRLDLRDTNARLAGEAGVLVPVTTDAHSVGALGYAELGIGQARRAWLTKEQVLNTRSWRDVQRARRR